MESKNLPVGLKKLVDDKLKDPDYLKKLAKKGIEIPSGVKIGPIKSVVQ